MSADRQGGVVTILGLWDSEADRDASGRALADVRDEGREIIGGDMTVENFEEVLVNVKAPPAPGKALFVQRARMDPSRMADNIAFFEGEIAPKIAANPGFCALRNMVDRQTGETLLGTVWDSVDAMHAALANSQTLMQQSVDRGVTFGDTSERELLFADMP